MTAESRRSGAIVGTLAALPLLPQEYRGRYVIGLSTRLALIASPGPASPATGLTCLPAPSSHASCLPNTPRCGLGGRGRGRCGWCVCVYVRACVCTFVCFTYVRTCACVCACTRAFCLTFLVLIFCRFRYPFHPRVTARKRSRSFCRKCTYQATAKHTCILRMWLRLK